MKVKTIALDFDGVIHAHRAPWTWPEQINDGPVPGAFEFMERALTEFNIIIFSARADSPQAREAVCLWLKKHWPAVQVVAAKGAGVHTEYAWIPVTNVKPHAFIYIDDRGWRFEGTFPTLEELRVFDSWTKLKGEPSRELRPTLGLAEVAEKMSTSLGVCVGSASHALTLEELNDMVDLSVRACDWAQAVAIQFGANRK